MKLGIIALINFSEWDNPDYPETGGVNSVIRNIIPYLNAEKIVLYGITYQKEKLLVEQKLSDRLSVFPVVYKSPGNVLPNRFLGFFLGWRLKKILRTQGIDYVYSHSEELCFWLSYTRIPYIHHLHTFVNALTVSGGRLARIKFLQTLWEMIRRRVISNAYKIISVNNEITQFYTPVIGRDRIIQFSNFVDQAVFTYRDPSSLSAKWNVGDRQVLLFIGRITRIKGMELFVDTVINLNLPTKKWIGMIVGNGDYEAETMSYIKGQQAEDQVIFTGAINDLKVLSMYYSLANVFLITSFSESVPLTLLESLSCGTPVVSTATGIAREVLNGTNGFVVDSRDANMFAEKVRDSVSFKSVSTLLVNGSTYSVQHASSLINQSFKS